MATSQFTLTKDNSDIFGALASGICLIHCIATPFLFVAQAGVATHDHHHGHGHATGPAWWGLIDIVFLVVSLIAVYYAIKTTSKQWIKTAFAISWIALAFFILNEKLDGFHVGEIPIYASAMSLVVLHVYNHRYCRCDDDTCRIQEEQTV